MLRESDWMVPSFRETAAQLWRGQSMESVLLAYGGYYQGNRVPQAINTLPTAIPVATQILHAAGIAYGIKLRGRDDVAMAFFGDGATSEGEIESLEEELQGGTFTLTNTGILGGTSFEPIINYPHRRSDGEPG